MTLQRVIPLSFVTILITFIIFANLPSITCLDPAGCILLQPGETLAIGVSRVSSGPGQNSSLEIQQSAELAIKQLSSNKHGPNLSIQPFIAPCLPESESGSSLDAASANHVIITFGPGCPTELVDFNTRMARSAKTGLSPLALFSLVGASSLENILVDLAKQAVSILTSMQYQSVIITSSTDAMSAQFLDIFCQILRQEEILCYLNLDENERILPEAKIFISLASENQFPFSESQSIPEIPTFLIALSRPQPSGNTTLDVQYWIGPTIWAGDKFMTDYLHAYQTVPESLEARITYDSIPYIIKSLQETSWIMQGGIWIVPRQAFEQSLEKNLKIFSRSSMSNCSAETACFFTPLSLFRLEGNEYKISKP